MAKQARGLPDTFKLDVSPAALGKPVELGDYLDEAPPPPKPRAPEAKAPPVVSQPPAQRPAPLEVLNGGVVGGQVQQAAQEPPAAPQRPLPAAPAPSPAPRPPARQQAPRPTRLATSVPRKQINMAPETIAMVEQLLDFVQTYGVQKDLKGSELFHGLVLALYEAREHIDLSRVQPRGRWGTPTAAALPIALKTAFQQAIRRYLDERNPG